MSDYKIFEQLQERFPYLVCSEPQHERMTDETSYPDSLKSRLTAENLLRFTGNIFLADTLRFSEDDEEIFSKVRSFLSNPSLSQLMAIQEAFIKRRRRRAIDLLGLHSHNPIEASLSLNAYAKLMEKFRNLFSSEALSSLNRAKAIWVDSTLNVELAGFVIDRIKSEVVHIDSKECRGYYLRSLKGEMMPLFPFFLGSEGRRMVLFDSFLNDSVLYIETETGRSLRTDAEMILASFSEFLLRIGLYTKASELFAKIRRKEARETLTDSERACECALRGYRFYQAGDFDSAVRELSKASRLKPDLTQLSIQLALSYAKLNEMDEAISVLGRLLEGNPSMEKGHELMGDMYMDKGDLLHAEEKYIEALRLVPNNKFLQRKVEKVREKSARKGSFRSEEESLKAEQPSRKIDEFMEDMIAHARRGKYHPVVEREEEIGKIITILSCSTKNNPLLIGDPGVGKTAIVEGLVMKAISGELPAHLARKKYYLMNVATLLAGTKYRGQFEERILDLIKEISNEDCIVFIDNIQNIISSGLTRGGSLDTSALLKPALIKGEMQIIGATTYDEYQNNIEKDYSLARCFQKVPVAEPDPEATVKILNAVLPLLEEHHSITFSGDAVRKSVELIRRYVREGCFPDKAIDVLDRAAATMAARSNEKALPDRVVGEKEILEAVSSVSGIPLFRIKASGKESLKNISSVLEKRIIGQEEAIEKVSKIVRSSLLGFKIHPQKPNAVLLFVGPTGVGKTECAKVITEALFGDEERLLRIDMSEYMERISSTRLIGSSPGYVGYNDQNQLTDKIRQNPYTVILLDEMEKADAQMINLFLQVFDAGRLTDGRGRTVNFNSSVIIMTSNIGTDLYFRTVAGYGKGKKQAPSVSRREVMKEIRRHFSPEFLNRVDEIVFFKTLSLDDVRKIALLQLGAIEEKLRSEGKELKVTEKALDIITEEGYSFEFGARNLGRAIREKVLDPLGLAALDDPWEASTTVTVDSDGREIKIVLR